MDKLKVRAVIFDLGSTLIEYETIPWPQLNIKCMISVRKMLKKKGYDIPEEEEFIRLFDKVKEGYRQIANETHVEWSVTEAAAKLLERLGIEENDNLPDKIFDAYYKPVGEEIYIYDDTFETVKKIKEKVGIVGLISNTIFPENSHLSEMERFNILSYFDFTIFSSTYGLRKPHPDIFYQALNQAGVASQEAVYIGDRYLEDIVGPKSVGMNAILKIKENREYPLDMPECNRTIYNLAELEEHIDLE